MFDFSNFEKEVDLVGQSDRPGKRVEACSGGWSDARIPSRQVIENRVGLH
jgi:hypothetical protein